ncbi:MAG TPA: IPT/TIG domain-containing protein, partial [Pyrinomonadaceae bacterium]
MLKRTTICALILLAVCAFFAVEKANAQQVWGSTDVIIDTNLRRIYGYHATEVDFIAWQYYEPLVEGFIYDQFGNELDFDSDVNHTGFTAEAFTESSYQPGRTFYVISDHYVGLLVPAPSPEGGGPAYWNPFGFGFSGPGGFFDFWGFGPGSPGFVVVQYIYLGSTGWELEFFGEPRIDQISPTSAPLDSNIELHFEGVNLGGNPTVNISGSGVTTGQIIFSTETRLSLNISISANAPTGNRSVTISTRGYTSNAVTFHIGDRSPHIDSINPSRGNAGSLVDVTLNGTNFGVNPILIITGGITGQVLSSTNTQINSRFTIPSSTLAGDYEVRVFSNGISGTGFINPGSGSATSNAVTFTVNATAAPRITDFAPKSGQLGTTVEVNVVGENFGTSRTLVIGGQGVTVQSYTSVSDPDHQIVATLNIAANAEVGDHSLRVSSGGQLSNSVNFRVGDPSPVISSINPSSGTAGTTFPVVITGSGFGSDPTVAVSGTGVSVTINQKSNTNIQATFQIASTAEAVLRQVTVTSRGVNGNGFTQTPGTNQSATHPFDIKKAEIKINSWDKQFAPSVERLNITYTIGPAGTVAPHARLEILKKGDKTNPVFVDNNIPKTGTVQYRGADGNLGWDGKDNNGNFIGPEGSPYTIRISIDDNSNFTNKKNATEEFKVEMFVEATMPPVPPKPGKTPVGTSAKEYSVIKPWNPTNPATELDTEITLKVLYLSKAGNNVKVGVALPYKVEWSFTDPDDTSSEREIDLSPNGGNGGDDNTLKDKNGKRPGPGQTSTMWKSSGFNFVLGGQGQTATSDIQTTAGPDQGSTKIKFSSSAVGGDNYLLKAVVKDASRVVHTVDFEKWSVRKA